jgi:hypothetical protein
MLPKQLPEFKTVDMRALTQDEAYEMRRDRVDALLAAFGLPVDDQDLRKRAGELLSYRQQRSSAMAAARALKAGLCQPCRVLVRDRDPRLLEILRSVRSQHRVVLRRLRMLRSRAASRTGELAA